MPKPGKPANKGGPSKTVNTVETDPWVHTVEPDPKELAAVPRATGTPLSRGTDDLSRTKDLGPTPPERLDGDRDDAWSRFDDAPVSAWDVSSVSVKPGPEQTAELDVLLPRRSEQEKSHRAPDGVMPSGPLVPTAKWVAVSGAEAGREFMVRHAESGVGRSSGNAVVLVDASVSREHAKLLFDGQRFVLNDLNSGNGTFVNGQRITRQVLRHGDEVVFGSVALRFVESSGEQLLRTGAAVQLRSPGMPTRGWRYAAAVTAILAVGVVIVGTLYTRRYGGLNGTEARQDMMFSHYTRGVAAFKGRHWDQADHEFTVALGLDPTHVRTKRYVKAVSRERLAETQLVEARQARKRGDLNRANSLAMGILDSSFRPEAQALLRDIDAECEARIVLGQQQLAAGQPLEAMQLLQSVDAIRPGRPDVAELMVRANLKGGVSRLTPASLADHAARRLGPVSGGPLAEARQQFINGDVQPALQSLDALNSEEAAALRNKIEKFWETYRSGLAEAKAKNASAAIRLLGEAKSLEQEISSGGSKLLHDIDRKLADMHYAQGMQSLRDGALPEAYQSFRSAVVLAPDHSAAETQLTDLTQRAQQFFETAGHEPDVQKARAALQTVLQIVAADSELYRKAKQRLDALPR